MKLDYDPLAPTYDQRYAASPMHSTGLSLLALAGKTPSGRILEAGCGTGHWLSELASHGYAIFGLDFSAGMLDQARASGALRTRGDAVHLPFAPGVFQLVFCVNALHHFGNPPRFIQAAAHCLAPGGVLAIFTSDPHDASEAWFVYDYFPGVWENDLVRFHPRQSILEWMVQAGLQVQPPQIAEQIDEPKNGRSILADPFLQKHACSQLALLSVPEYEAGLAAIRADLEAAEQRGETLVFPSRFTLWLLTGWKPG